MALSAGATAEDRLSIRSTGTNAGQISVVDDRIYYTKNINQSLSTLQIGVFSGGQGATPLIVEFNSNAFRLELQATLRALVFENTSDTPSVIPREVRFAIADGDGGVSNSASRILNVLAVNDIPSITVTPTFKEYQPSGTAVVIDEGVIVFDIDSLDFDGGKLMVRITAGAQPSDRLEVVAAGHVTVDSANQTVSFDGEIVGSYSGTTKLTIHFNHLASAEIVQAVARRIAYRSLLMSPSSTPREIGFVVTDGDGGTSYEALGDRVSIRVANNAPELILSDDAPAKFIENGAPVLIANAGIVSDVDLLDFDTGVLTVSIIRDGAEADRLSIQHATPANGKISVDSTLGKIFYTTNSRGTYQIASFTGGANGSQLLVSFNTNALKTEVQSVMRAIIFSNDSEDPSTASRTVQFTLTDGDGGLSNSVTRTIQVVARNDASIISNFGDDVEWTRGSGALLIAPNATVSDVDSADFFGGKLVVALNANAQSTDRIEISEGEGISVSGDVVLYNGHEIGTFAGKSSLTITFTTVAADQAAVEALLRRISFRSTSTSLLTRGVRVVLHDGDGGVSAAQTKQIFIDNP